MATSFKSGLHPMRVALEGQLMRAVITPSNRICGVVHVYPHLSKRLVCLDSSGKRLWQVDIASEENPYGAFPLQVAPNGVLWLGLSDRLCAFNEKGHLLVDLPLNLEPHEHLGSFQLKPDGFLVSIYQKGHQTKEGPLSELSPRITFLNRRGEPRWSTSLPVALLQFEGIVEASADSNWKAQPKAAWRPRSWTSDIYTRDPLLLSGNCLLASFIDISSGVSVSYCLNTASGDLLWQTPSLPFSHRAIAGHEKFLLGVGGYGLSLTQLRDGNGTVLGEWEQNGLMCVRTSGEIMLIQEFNRPAHVWELYLDGTAQQGAQIPGIHSTHPILTQDGQISFWRAGSLFQVGHDLGIRVLHSAPEMQDYLPTKGMLLCPDGTLVVSMFRTQGGGSQIWFFPSFGVLEGKSL